MKQSRKPASKAVNYKHFHLISRIRLVMRLDKFVCKSTALTKNEALLLIQRGQLFVNGTPETDAAKQVHENNEIVLAGQRLTPRPFRYVLMNKLANTICSNVDELYPSLLNSLSINNVAELHVAGRLDADTTGLVLITDDGRWSYNITRPQMKCPKVYRVNLARPISNTAMDEFQKGILLQGEQKPTLPALLEIITPTEVLLTITEGKYHQVKRMFAAVGNKVRTLHREQIGEVVMDVAPGQWRYLTKAEIDSF